jgi:hypothetical protein
MPYYILSVIKFQHTSRAGVRDGEGRLGLSVLAPQGHAHGVWGPPPETLGAYPHSALISAGPTDRIESDRADYTSPALSGANRGAS